MVGQFPAYTINSKLIIKIGKCYVYLQFVFLKSLAVENRGINEQAWSLQFSDVVLNSLLYGLYVEKLFDLFLIQFIYL